MNNKFPRYKIALFIFTILIILLTSIYIVEQESDHIKSHIKSSEQYHLNLIEISLEQKIKDVIADLYIFSNTTELKNYLNNKSERNYKILGKGIANYSMHYKMYYKIRLINTLGKEILKINFNKNHAVVASPEQLENKQSSYYFKNAIKLKKDQIYISPIDLDVEEEGILKPILPTIRFCTPVFNSKGKKEGIFVLSFNANNFLQIIPKEKQLDMLGSVMLLNKNGYFLQSENRNQQLFGFMLKQNTNSTFQKYYRDEWKTIDNKSRGSFFSENGLFTYISISPKSFTNQNGSFPTDEAECLEWKLVTFVPHYAINAKLADFKNLVISIDLGILAFLFFGFTYYYRFDRQRTVQQNKLHESSSWNKQLFEGSRDAIFIVDAQSAIVDCNNAASVLTGYSKNELLKMSIPDLHKEEDLEAFKKYFQRIIHGEKILSKAKIRRKNQELVETEFSSNRIIINDITYMHTLARDITERAIVESLLKTSEKKARVIIESAPDAVITIDGDGIISGWSNTAEKIFGYKSEDIIGENIVIIIPDRFVNRHKNALDKAKSTRKFNVAGKGVIEIIGKRNNGSEFPISMAMCHWEVDEELYFTAFVRDETERIKIYNKLKESEESYRSLFESINDSIIVADRERNIVSVNNAFKLLFEYDEKEVIGRKTLMLYKNIEQFNELGNLIKENLDGTKSFTYTIDYKTKYGKNFTGETSLFYLRNVSNEIIGVIGIIKDITEKQKQELQVKKLLEVIEQTPVSIAITDVDGNMEYVNPHFEKITGYSLDEVKGQNSRLIKSGYQDEFVYKQLWNTISSGISWRGELLNKKKDGTVFWENCVITPIVDENIQIVNYVAIKEDITEKKENEKKIQEYQQHLEELVEKRTADLKTSEAKFRSIAENSEDAITRFDKNFRFIFANPGVAKQTGIDLKEFIGKTHAEIGLPKEHCQLFESTFRKVFKTKKKQLIEFQLPNKNWIDAQIIPEFDTDGNVSSIIAFGRDITNRKKAENVTIQAFEKEKETNELKTRFISTISHDIRTPLTSIKSSAELLKKYGLKWNEEKKNELFERISGSVNYLVEVVENVLAISRTERGEIIFSPQTNNIKQFFKSEISKLNSIHFDHQITMQYSGKEEVEADSNLLSTVFTNLVNNAVKYSPDSSSIFVKIDVGTKLTICVEDKGVGIPKEGVKHLFEPFYRAENADKFKGSGLGLSMVKTNIEKMKGTISVESKLGSGSSFTVTLPIKY